MSFFFFFFNDTATTEIYTLSLHDALPIWCRRGRACLLDGAGSSRSGRPKPRQSVRCPAGGGCGVSGGLRRDRKSTRLNSSHSQISYAVFCLKKKKKINSEMQCCSTKTQSI